MLPAGDGQRIAWLHAHGEVVSEDAVVAELADGASEPLRRLQVRLTPRELGRYTNLQ